MTPAEANLWVRLHRSQLGGFHFRRQQVIEPYIVDFYCNRAGLVVEMDGAVHAGQAVYDRQHEQYLHGRGLCVMRYTNEEVLQNLDGVLEDILRICIERKDRRLE